MDGVDVVDEGGEAGVEDGSKTGDICVIKFHAAKIVKIIDN